MFNFSNQEPMEDKTPPPQGNRGPKFDVNGKEIPISLARVWSLLIAGHSAIEGAKVLGIKVPTFNSHKRTISNKFDNGKGTALVAYGVLHGFDLQGNFKGYNLFEGMGD
jgi:hypothetical protein